MPGLRSFWGRGEFNSIRELYGLASCKQDNVGIPVAAQDGETLSIGRQETPREAQVANISGTVVLHAIIGWDGRPHELQYVSGPGVLAQAAIDAVRWWQYRLETDEPTEIDRTISVEFPSANN